MSVAQTQPSLSQEQLLAEYARLLAENAKLKGEKGPKGMSLKVSEKGALSVYGLGRFPVTLYKSQWERLFAEQDKIQGFIKANEMVLKTKE